MYRVPNMCSSIAVFHECVSSCSTVHPARTARLSKTSSRRQHHPNAPLPFLFMVVLLLGWIARCRGVSRSSRTAAGGCAGTSAIRDSPYFPASCRRGSSGPYCRLRALAGMQEKGFTSSLYAISDRFCMCVASYVQGRCRCLRMLAPTRVQTVAVPSISITCIQESNIYST